MLSHKHYLQTKVVESAKHKKPKPKRSHVNFMQCDISSLLYFNLETCSECNQNFQLFLLKQPDRSLSTAQGISGIRQALGCIPLPQAYLPQILPPPETLWAPLLTPQGLCSPWACFPLPPTHINTRSLKALGLFPSYQTLHSCPYPHFSLTFGRSLELVLEKEARLLNPSTSLQVVRNSSIPRPHGFMVRTTAIAENYN